MKLFVPVLIGIYLPLYYVPFLFNHLLTLFFHHSIYQCINRKMYLVMYGFIYAFIYAIFLQKGRNTEINAF